MKDSWIVHKFGGTSVANAERYRKVAEIMAVEPGSRKAIVVSAMSGVTDKLIELVELAKKQDELYRTKSDELKQQHLRAAEGLGILDSMKSVFDVDFANLGDILRAVWLGKSYSEETLELVAGHGELWSAQMLDAYLRTRCESRTDVPTGPASGIPKSRWLDARQVLTVRPGETGPIVDWEISKPRFQQWLNESETPWIVITGYVASTRRRRCHDAQAQRKRLLGFDLRRAARRRGRSSSGPTSTAC